MPSAEAIASMAQAPAMAMPVLQRSNVRKAFFMKEKARWRYTGGRE
jgi:hypothetical protein